MRTESLWLEVLVYQADDFRGKEAPVGDDESLDRFSDNKIQAWYVED